ncbi:MAG: NAD(+)/NADH kinase [Lachnospiraceae bacterium]|nr:NAD(+)/NADH kinase [Lachnospiraceae bacterium]
MKKIGIISNSLKDKELKVAELAAEKLRALGAEVSIADLCDDKELNDEADALIVIGGDGSMLSAAKRVREAGTPLLGINLGCVGYLTEVELNDIDSCLKRLAEGDYSVSERMMLSGRCTISGKIQEESRALNDIVLSRHGTLLVAGYRIYVNGSFLGDFYADGVIISTPTGSTAYNMSAGGPIVSPSARLIVLTPVCSHSLNSRSIVFSESDELTVEILEARGGKKAEIEVSYDGSGNRILGCGDRLTARASDKVTRIIKMNDDGFLQVLNRKMSL